MPRIRCHYVECVFLDGGYCGASSVEIDPELGCMTFIHIADASQDDNWDEDEIQEGREEEEPLELDDDEDDPWLQEEGT